MNSYELSRKWFDFAFENPNKVKPIHGIVYFFAIEHCNRLGWKKIFGFPTSMVLEATGVKSYSSYKKHFDELVDWGFFKVHEYSKNQYSSNIIELSLNDKALDKALDKAFIKHDTKQVESTSESTSESIDSIDKPIYKEPITNNIQELVVKLISPPLHSIFKEWLEYRKGIKKPIVLTVTIEKLIKKFNNHSIQQCELIVNNSIENNYQGLIWDKVKPYKESPSSSNGHGLIF